MRKIWIINEYAGSPFHGAGTRHYYLGLELAKQGGYATIISASYSHLFINPPRATGVYTSETIEGVNYIWIKVPYYASAYSWKRVLKSLLFSFRILALSKQLKEAPDVIVASSPELFPIPSVYRLARKFNAKFVFEVRDIWPLSLIVEEGYSKYHPGIITLQWIEDFAYQKADVVISLLPNAFEHIRARGCSENKYFYIPNGISVEEMEKMEPLPEEIKGSIPKSKFVIGYTGTIGFANALEYLLPSAKLLKGEGDIHFLIVGKGSEKEKIVAMSKELGLTNVTFLPPIPKRQVQPLLREFIDVCYMGLRDSPLYQYGISSNKLFDYFYAGKPIIYAVNSSNRPVDEAGAGISVPAGNPEAIAEAILKLKAMSPEEREEMGRRGREYVIANHNWEILAKKFLKVI